VLFTARDGATISGHVWATVAGPAKRPGIVITNGSVQADEQMYWYAAHTLAKAGYVVLTFDPQGQGQSDTLGQSPDTDEGVPAQTEAFGASLRGPDITDWYTTAWFDKYLEHAPGADAMLLSERWRDDPVEARVDPGHDGNAFSFYYYSRLDIHLAGGHVWDCEDLRDGCAGMVPDGQDGYPGNYSYVAIDTSPDAVTGPDAALARRGSSLTVAPRAGAGTRVARKP